MSTTGQSAAWQLLQSVTSTGRLALAIAVFWVPATSAEVKPTIQGATLAKSNRLTFYVGTYTRGESQGIYVFELDRQTGELQQTSVAGGIENPSFLAIHPSQRFLFAVSEVGDFADTKSGAVYAFAIQQGSGELAGLNRQSSRGTGPCHLVIDEGGNHVLVANYGGGSVACLPIREDGHLVEASSFIQHSGSSVNPRRQAGPHAHSINLDPANRYAVAADLGLDQLLVYHFDASRGSLVANDEKPFAPVAAGAGPRHFAFHPSGKYAFVINEMNSTITAFAYDGQRGTLQPRQTISTLPAGFSENNSTAEVQVHPSGKFLYGSNRGHDSIAVFSIDASTGQLTLVEHQSTLGSTPRNFGISPAGQHLIAANQRTGTIVSMRINDKTGQLTPTGESAQVPSPVCIKFLDNDRE